MKQEKNIKTRKFKDTKNSNKGITLIALVITIIVLLILAGVTIAILSGPNGILNNAQEAKKQTIIANVIEQAKIDIASKMAEKLGESLTEQEIADILDKYGELSTEQVELKDKILTTYEGTYEIPVSDIYNGEINSEPSIPEGLEIGETVIYEPSGECEYQWDSEYCSSPEDTSFGKILKSGKGESFYINTWKVFDIDEETGEVTLVPAHSTDDRADGTVHLEGTQGYNNGVKLLNDACSALYGDSDRGITARSINIEDIEGKMTEEAKADAYANGNKTYVYEEQVESPYTEENSKYPIIYADERLSSIENENSKELKISQQDSLIGATDNGAEDGYLPATSIQPYNTYWYGANDFMQIAFESENDVNYYDLLMPDGTNTFYWVASRCVDAYSNICVFYVRAVSSGGVGARYVFDSSGYVDDSNFYGLFPVVSLSTKLIEGNETEGFSVVSK